MKTTNTTIEFDNVLEVEVKDYGGSHAIWIVHIDEDGHHQIETVWTRGENVTFKGFEALAEKPAAVQPDNGRHVRMGAKSRERITTLLTSSDDGFTVKQIGAFMGMKPSTVYNVITELRFELGDKLETRTLLADGRVKRYRIAS